MNNIDNLAKFVRDAQFLSMKVLYENTATTPNTSALIELEFIKNEDHYLVHLKEPKRIDIFEDEVYSQYIGQLKCYKDEYDDFWLSLDPGDDVKDEITEKDNYVFGFKGYKIIKVD